MKPKQILPNLIITLILLQTITGKAQNITADTTLANSYFETASIIQDGVAITFIVLWISFYKAKIRKYFVTLQTSKCKNAFKMEKVPKIIKNKSEEINELCERFNVEHFYVFGSVCTPNFNIKGITHAKSTILRRKI